LVSIDFQTCSAFSFPAAIMGGICGCLAGVQPPEKKPAPKKDAKGKSVAVTEKTPLVSLPAAVQHKTRDLPAAAPAAAAPEPAPTESTGLMPPLSVGSRVEVYSNSCTSWCPGVVQAIDAESILVAYQVPNTDQESKISTKTLPLGTPELRAPAEPVAYVFGATVEVYSHSYQTWCPALIQDITDNVATVSFFYPDMAQDTEPIIKSLPIGHEDLRLPTTSATGAAGGHAHDNLAVGSPVEVFSNSLGVWCPGHVHELRDGKIIAAFHYPDMDPDGEPVVKEMPSGHQDLRLRIAMGCPIEVYSHSRQFWCPGLVKDVQEGMVTVLIRYPDLPPESELFEKVLPLGDPDLRLLGAS